MAPKRQTSRRKPNQRSPTWPVSTARPRSAVSRTVFARSRATSRPSCTCGFSTRWATSSLGLPPRSTTTSATFAIFLAHFKSNFVTLSPQEEALHMLKSLRVPDRDPAAIQRAGAIIRVAAGADAVSACFQFVECMPASLHYVMTMPAFWALPLVEMVSGATQAMNAICCHTAAHPVAHQIVPALPILCQSTQ
ncbi:hypothetical protein BC828DRAFT_394682 [Blastocladiella britannica]|nr:hypothetical protein BC828DRAFT_394682 [Blastocladiella britannica]